MMTRPLAPAKIEYDGRYCMRPVEPRDVPQIEQALKASLPQLRMFMDWAHHLQNRAHFLERVLTQLNNYYRGDEYEMALFEKESGKFLVYTGFYPTLRLNPHCFEIGYWTSAEHRGKGLATLVTQIQIALIFEYFKGDRVEITCGIQNQASLQVIQKCGFHQEGELRNFYPQGTPQMFADGYTKERRVALFSLIPEDRPSLPWYSDILTKTLIFPFLESPTPLQYYATP